MTKESTIIIVVARRRIVGPQKALTCRVGLKGGFDGRADTELFDALFLCGKADIYPILVRPVPKNKDIEVDVHMQDATVQDFLFSGKLLAIAAL